MPVPRGKTDSQVVPSAVDENALVPKGNTDDRIEDGINIPLPGMLVLLLVLLIIAAFYVATIRGGNYWPDDYALYVHHAKNIAEGAAYGDTGYVYNRDVADYSPRAYPPVFPVMLAPIYRLFGMNFWAMKVEVVSFFLLTLIVVALYWERDLSWPYLAVLIALLGFNPHFWRAKDAVLADLPFLLFFYLAALLASRAPREGPAWTRAAVAMGVVMYLCIGTRTVGVTVLIGLILYELVKYRKLTRFAMLSAVISITLVIVQRSLFGTGEQSYADQLHPTLASVLTNCRNYPSDFMTLWGRPWGRIEALALFAFTTVLACVGAYFYRTRGLTTLEAFLLPYIAVILLWPSPQGLRFLYPLIPFYVFLVLLGLQEFARFWLKPARRFAVAVVPILLGACYATAYSHADYGIIQQANGQPSFNELCEFIRAHTAPNDILIFRRSRALSLFTSRPAALYSLANPDQIAAELERLHATFIVASPIFDEDQKVLIPFVQSHMSSLEEVYNNADFQVYRIRGR